MQDWVFVYDENLPTRGKGRARIISQRLPFLLPPSRKLFLRIPFLLGTKKLPRTILDSLSIYEHGLRIPSEQKASVDETTAKPIQQDRIPRLYFAFLDPQGERQWNGSR